MIDDFENFVDFNLKWKTTMPMHQKMLIAMQSDDLNNKGANAYNDDECQKAIGYFEQALSIMPNNDDALQNLRMCYSEIGDIAKLQLVLRKLNYLGI
jgi:tetratricopeptide (TPR) repeat protein